MKPALVDTDTLSMFFRGDPCTVTRFQAYLDEYAEIKLSIVTYYEIVSGLRHRDAAKQLDAFLEFARRNAVLPITAHSANISADLYARLRREGQPLDDIDLLIAGVALANGLVLATHNTDHFGRIEELEIQDWSR
jgi:tRNA(fMet)-specific endonuclease VapC